MSVTCSFEQIDSILDELDHTARSRVATKDFLDQLIRALVRIFHTSYAAVVVTSEKGCWIPLAESQAAPPELSSVIIRRFRENPKATYWLASNQGRIVLAVPAASLPSMQMIVVTLESSEDLRSVDAASTVLSGFAEVLLLREIIVFRKVRETLLSKAFDIASQIARSETLEAASAVFVQGTKELLAADRVSLFQADDLQQGNPYLVAVSDCPVIDRGSEEAILLQKKAALSSDLLEKSLQVDVRHELAEGGESLRIGLEGRTPGSGVGIHFLFAEWWSQPVSEETKAVIPLLQKILGFGWESHWLAHQNRSVKGLLGDRKRRLRRFTGVATPLFILGAIVAGTMIPMEFASYCDGYLEPKVRGKIYAHHDSYIEELEVVHGQLVHQGDRLGRLRSSDLDLRVEEVLGSLRTLEDKRNSLKLAINQLRSKDRTGTIDQNRLSSDLLIADQQKQHYLNKLAYLEEEQEKLKIISPLTGMVSLDRSMSELKTRPLKRGEAVLEVYDGAGDWHLVLKVPERDSLWIRELVEKKMASAEVVFDALPSETFQIPIASHDQVIENPNGFAPFLRAQSEIPKDLAAKLFLGAKAHARILIGKRPAWYVWMRPFLEAIQKRFLPFG